MNPTGAKLTNLAPNLVAALKGLTVIRKSRAVNAGRINYRFADIADVVEHTRPVLAEHGIIALTPVHDFGDGLACTVILVHESGDTMDFPPFSFPHGKDAQATGSMVTYHRRYALLAALGMATADPEDDDDGASAVARPVEPHPISEANVERLIDKCVAAGLSPVDVVELGTNGRTDDPAQVLTSEIGAVREALDKLATEGDQ